MAFFHGNAIPGGATSQEIWSPSSNDWDYTFDGSGDWPAVGNALGDHTQGGFVDNISGDSSLSSLFTFDGDFEITWTAVASLAGVNFGVHEITEDDSRTVNHQQNGMGGAVQSFRYQQSVDGGANDNHFWIGATQESGSSNVFAVGSVIKIERISGTIKVYDDDVEVHEFTSTTSNPVRFFIGSDGNTAHDFENIFFTDSEKVQRDGFLNNTTIANQGVGEGTVFGKAGILFRPTRTGEISSVTVNVATVNTTYTAHWELWSHDGTNPSSQIGSDSDSSSISATGNKIITWTTKPTVNKGTYYWLVLVDEGTNGSIDLNLHTDVTAPNWGSARHDTITSMAEDTNITSNRVWKCEIEIDTSAGEPTPDHDTLLLIHSDTSDASTTFTDSSQYAMNLTAGGNAQHDTAQALGFGTSSILFDGTGDYVYAANQAPFDDMDGAGFTNFTVDAIIRSASIGSSQCVMSVGDGGSWANMLFLATVTSAGKLNFQASNGGGAGVNLTGSTTLSADTNYHVAYVKAGNVFTVYLNGTSDGTTTSSITLATSSDQFRVGLEADGSWGFNGWIKEPRFSLCARWDADFTPPTVPYP